MFLKLFPLWAPLAALVGFLGAPLLASWGGAIVPLLMLVMLCMGLTLKPVDFVALGTCKRAFLVGMLLQFTVMPLAALLIATLVDLGPELTIGLVLVGSVAGGTSSNVMTYLAGGNVALSVSMTACSTLASTVMTPLLLAFLVGSSVQVPAAEMMLSLVQIILLPVGIGVLVNTLAAGAMTTRLHAALAPLSVMTILLIIAIVVAINAQRVAEVAVVVVLATLAHNVTGLTLGYLTARLVGFDSVICRTIAIEVGMQNSGLATALALKFFTPLSALPGAIFSVWLNITGSVFASVMTWSDSRKPRK
ncbi:bile acid:sodium symporter family protein [Kineobactrum salinum]|uniref:Bile acid:sodium symporter family protein n=2 Tax=Kineobactrum salinum TaxID=2708301 RepID=A0A6C0U786_9GAMM|nr:bile acid:sodium symporter family protein [Kineobactrum salinum]